MTNAHFLLTYSFSLHLTPFAMQICALTPAEVLKLAELAVVG